MYTYTLANITEASNDSDLTSKHDIGGTLDTIDEGLAASVVVVELGLGNGVIDVNGRNLELAVTESLVQVVDTSGGFLRDTANTCEDRYLGEDLPNMEMPATHQRGPGGTSRGRESSNHHHHRGSC